MASSSCNPYLLLNSGVMLLCYWWTQYSGFACLILDCILYRLIVCPELVLGFIACLTPCCKLGSLNRGLLLLGYCGTQYSYNLLLVARGTPRQRCWGMTVAFSLGPCTVSDLTRVACCYIYICPIYVFKYTLHAT